jgi:membrane fusion protein, peptide pheromone/bacteriocin exporter
MNSSQNNSYFPTYPRTAIIYISCIVFLFVCIALLPYLKTDVSVRSYALIRPASEVSILHSISSGRIKESYLFENKKVKEGDVLYVIESETLNEQEKYHREKIALTESFIQDAKLVIASSSIVAKVTPAFSNALYRQSYFAYAQKLSEAQTHYNKARQAHDRQYKMYSEQVIAAMEFESFQFELKKAEDAIAQIKESQRSQWQIELKNLEEQKRDLESQLIRVQKEKSTLTIKSPINGTAQNLAGVYAGSFVSVNQELAQISPDTSLLVIAYVQPNDIGLLKAGMNVRLQVDAFNYNQWGLALGKIKELPQDIKIIDNKPVFEVRCELEKDFLQLKNGYKGMLKKGMTAQARFIITERSLWQLLYDKVDDWVNPNLSEG